MTPDNAIELTYKFPRGEQKYKPTMIDYKHAIRAINKYSDHKLRNIIDRKDSICLMGKPELKKKITDLLYLDGVDAIVNYIKSEL